MEVNNEILGSVISAAHFQGKHKECSYQNLQKWDGMLHKGCSFSYKNLQKWERVPHKLIFLHPNDDSIPCSNPCVILSYGNVCENDVSPLRNRNPRKEMM